MESYKVQSSMFSAGMGFNYVFETENSWDSAFYNNLESEKEVSMEIFCPNYSANSNVCYAEEVSAYNENFDQVTG